MKHYFRWVLFLFLFCLTGSVVLFHPPIQAASLSDRLRGFILLQVEEHGEAWYVHPVDGRRYYMRDGTAAYEMMRRFGLGITTRDLQRLLNGDTNLQTRLRGRIVLQVEAHGEAYYLCPRTGRVTYLRDGAAAFTLLRECGLGITTRDLETIAIGTLGSLTVPAVTPPMSYPLITGQSPRVGSCQIFPDNNPWNQNISQAPLHPQSSAYIANIGVNESLHADFGEDQEYGLPYVVVGAGQARVPITFTAYGDESDPGPYPVPTNAPIEGGNDQHVLVVDQDACMLYEMYHARRDARGSGWLADAGAVFDLKSNVLRPLGWTSGDAAGLPIFPGLVRYDEVAAGAIHHAIRFTTNDSQNGVISPARHFVGADDVRLPAMGQRFRLKANFDLRPFTGQARVIAEAMKAYGLILADHGANWYFQGATDPRWNDEELNQLKDIPGSAFEAVYTGPIQKPL